VLARSVLPTEAVALVEYFRGMLRIPTKLTSESERS
jgi:hypothetical protein